MTELPSRASESCQGGQRSEEFTVEIGDIHGKEVTAVEQAATANSTGTVGCTIWNDLRVAAELKIGQGSGWHIIYPEAGLNLAEHSMDDTLHVFVRIRDDVTVCGMCTTVRGSILLLSTSFGDFGDRAAKIIRKEEDETEQESLLRKQRQEEINKKLNEELTQPILWRQNVAVMSIWVCLLILLGAMVFCTVATFSATELQGVGLTLALLGLASCAWCGFVGLMGGTGEVEGTHSHMQEAVQAARPELQQFELSNGLLGIDRRWMTFGSCFCCLPLVILGSLAAVTVANGLNGYDWALAVLWGPMALLMCCGGVIRYWDYKGASWRGRAQCFVFALLFPCLWPWVLLTVCGFHSRFAALLLKPPKRLLDAAINTTHEHTIVFEGNVLPGRETVCSWPGKYATAWDTLVAGSRQDDISAAVVFLPEGSQHFGLHDPIPASKDLQDLHGDCWCTPLYGEHKPWGCRWWSKWIANIELTVAQECTVVVYYFNGRRGQGKVKDFTTAGEEHVRREAIEQRRKIFLESEAFRNALEAGLKHLPKDKGPDSSSPYSREVQRLFLAWLPQEDRQFLVSSEGLGNSQKAEVAWLKRKGYSYIEKEVWELESSSPKAIGRATQQMPQFRFSL